MESPSAREDMQAELQRLLAATPDAYRERLRERYGPVQDVVAGRRAVVIYPAARMAQQAAAILARLGVEIKAFSDGNPRLWGSEVRGLPVVAPESIVEHAPEAAVFVASSLHDSAIRERLRGLGLDRVYPMPYLHYEFPDAFPAREYAGALEAPFRPGASAAILRLWDRLADDESRRVLVHKLRYYLTLDKQLLESVRSRGRIYFDSAVYRLGEAEIVVDGGAFKGDTLAEFQAAMAGRFRRYYAFEPDPTLYRALCEGAAADATRIECVRAGLHERSGELHFEVTGGADTRVAAGASTGTEALPVVGLAEFFVGRAPPTIIKLDVEGSETAALRGAGALLGNPGLRVAASAYHQPQDLWEIPLLLAELMPSAAIYLRHYTREFDDTVCYAVS